MRGAVVVFLIVAGCKFDPHQTPSDGLVSIDTTVVITDAADRDAPIDVSMALEGIPACFGTFVTVCIDTPTGSPTFPATLDTDNSPLCEPYTSPQGIDACVISGASISLSSGTVAAVGKRPLILVSTGNISFSGSGVLDAASHLATGAVGAGGDSTMCPTTQTNPTTTNTKSGGGWGATFGGPGGNGGNGGGGGIGGVAAGAINGTTLRGGCVATPGAASVANTGGVAGHGGGAVMLIALSQISISGSGVIDVSGSAGGGGKKNSGGLTGGGAGGGGGSGGMLVLESPNVAVSGGGQLFANGAGGGEGASSSNDGQPGHEPTAPSVAGGGGNGGAGTGGDGGQGSVGGQAAGSPGSSGGTPTGGGGGGGGGAGIIKISAPTQSGTGSTGSVAPPPTT